MNNSRVLCNVIVENVQNVSFISCFSLSFSHRENNRRRLASTNDESNVREIAPEPRMEPSCRFGKAAKATHADCG